MRVAIIGTGALACLFGARLAAHAQVCLLGSWPQGIAAINKRGICVETDGAVETARVPASSDAGQFAPAAAVLL
ncbi:MAG TPA: 2-dehydropantoate 2-reductase N-terminal domain-containing protein, partial [Anaerolineales bacterium]|nr:2-dehydropantoate 2-reductase N-terminal domain-containing protein [Anaerolineales bacterium]